MSNTGTPSDGKTNAEREEEEVRSLTDSTNPPLYGTTSQTANNGDNITYSDHSCNMITDVARIPDHFDRLNRLTITR